RCLASATNSMKTRFTPSLALSLLIAASAFADPADFGANITIFDNNSRTHSWYGNHEDNETETNPDTLIGQQWDLEGIFLDNNLNLTLVGGYDFKNGAVANGKTYRSGDIFIDIDGDASYGLPLAGSVTGGSGNDNHYSISLDVSFLAGSTATFPDTTECGNDDLVGRADVPGVPDASSTGALLAAALLTARGIARRRALVARRTQHAA